MSATADPPSDLPEPLRRVRASAYVTPLREGGSLPGLLEADDDGLYVTKFRGAGQGTASLIAEVVVGRLGALLGVRVPELVVVELDPRIAPREPDEEVQDLLKASAGANLGMDFLPGSIGYDGKIWVADPLEAARVLWLDAFTANVDRTWRNPNLLIWHRQLWAIDHGAALVFQHSWPPATAWAQRRYDLSQHVLLPPAQALGAPGWAELDADLAALVTRPALAAALAAVPDEWLLATNVARSQAEAGTLLSPDQWRERYVNQLSERVAGERVWQQGIGS